jgi:hypothetical protein
MMRGSLFVHSILRNTQEWARAAPDSPTLSVHLGGSSIAFRCASRLVLQVSCQGGTYGCDGVITGGWKTPSTCTSRPRAPSSPGGSHSPVPPSITLLCNPAVSVSYRPWYGIRGLPGASRSRRRAGRQAAGCPAKVRSVSTACAVYKMNLESTRGWAVPPLGGSITGGYAPAKPSRRGLVAVTKRWHLPNMEVDTRLTPL